MPKHKFNFAPPVESIDILEVLVKINTVLYHRYDRNADGMPSQWRINGQMKRWKRTPDRIYLPIKHGLYDYDAICSLDEFNQFYATSYNNA